MGSPSRRALLSVWDKTGLTTFARGLVQLGFELLSTGGTGRALREAGLRVTDVSAVTGFPEMLGGRVKTLHPRIHGGLLGLRGNPEHEAEMAAQDIRPIDLVAVNLYPFEAAAAKTDVSLAEAIENIDIGGPAILRSAAKNFLAVAVIVDPADYTGLLEEMASHEGGLPLGTRFSLARKAFAHTARYDAHIAGFLESVELPGDPALPLVRVDAADFPALLELRGAKLQDLRYGENPHQRAALYRDLQAAGGLAAARQLQGKALSYNNLVDLDAARELASEFDQPVVVILKHTNPCGVATASSLLDAYLRARATDPVSAYGGIIGTNRPLDEATAREIAATFVEALVAPGFSEGAHGILQDRKNLRLLELPSPLAEVSGLDDFEVRRVSGGLLVQERDRTDLDSANLTTVTRRQPTAAELRGLRFAWRVAKHVKSNAIVLTTEDATVGIGAGQMSRVDSVKLAIMKANFPTQGTVLASDAFFPFRDGVDAAAGAGATAIIQPGGSIRDAEVIGAADEHGMAMVFTGIRHFRH